MRILTTLLVVLSVTTLSAQSYIRFNVGYAFPINAELIGEESDAKYNSNTGEETESVSGVYGTYGSGINFQAAYGNSFGEGVLGYDLEIGYLIGKTHNIKSTYTQDGYTESSSEESKSSSFQVAPSLSFTTTTGKIQPYTRIGPVLSFTTMTFEQRIDIGGNDIALAYKAKGGISVGFKGALGINFSPTKKTQFFSEVNFISMAYAPKEAKLNKFNVNGVDELGGLSSEEKTISFEKDYKLSSFSDENIQTREKYSMGSISIQVGLRISLN